MQSAITTFGMERNSVFRYRLTCFWYVCAFHSWEEGRKIWKKIRDSCGLFPRALSRGVIVCRKYVTGAVTDEQARFVQREMTRREQRRY